MAVLVLMGSACLISCNESKNYYATSSDAVKDGAIARGWLPEVLRTNVTEIHESHDLDSNHGIADFRCSSGLISDLQQRCILKTAADGQLGYQCESFSISLNPSKLTGHLSH